MTNTEKLIELHGQLEETNPYCYCEIAYTRQTMWMAWLCSNSREEDPRRKILAKGQGETAEEACGLALENYRMNVIGMARRSRA